ncbi:MAG: serine/threonine protein kinase [Myxococcales bacterium]|nr:serine/threonine protein kinase [Myxococcales bacterium]
MEPGADDPRGVAEGDTEVAPTAPAPPRTITDTGEALAATVDGRGPRGSPPVDDWVGRTIGRYRLEARLGAGGMGVVWAALDPALDRRVALKVLPPLEPDRRAHLEVRLRREAQALARLDHPNVIAVYDVGVAAESVFIAMQLVDGATLDGHLASARPPPARVIALYLDACRGLAAAHDAGIIHRDVKPSNLLVDKAGRLYVGDFGLARGAGTVDDASPGDHSLLSAEMTRAGAVMGTPLYMAPEQHAGEAATARADQYSLCVSMWEALFGQHPFATGRWDHDAALAAMRADRPVEPAHRRGVPPRVTRALRRGLAFDPAARFASMADLAAAIGPRGHGARIAAGAGALGIGGAVALTLTLTSSAATNPCAHSGAGLDARWSTTTRQQLASSLAAIADGPGPAAGDRALQLLDQRADRWRATAIETCEATRVRHAVPVATMRARAACLDRSLASFSAAVAELGRAATVADLYASAAVARAGLDASACATAVTPPAAPPSRDLIDRVAALQVMTAAGRTREALADGPALAAEAERAGDTESAANAWWTVAQASGWTSTALARDATRRAAQAATAIGHHERAAEAWASAIDRAGVAGDWRAIDDLLAMARGAATAAGTVESQLLVDAAEASVAVEKADYPRAEELARQVLDATADRPGAGSRSRAFDVLGDVYLRSRRWPQLAELARAQHARAQAEYGAASPRAAAQLGRIAIAEYFLGNDAEAARLWDQGEAELTRAYDGPSVALVNALYDRIRTVSSEGNEWSPAARELVARSATAAAAVLPPDDQQVGRIVFNQARIAAADDRGDEARALFDRAVAIYAAQDNVKEWAVVANGAAMFDQADDHCDRAIVRFEEIITRGTAAELSPRFLGLARCGLGSCQTIADADRGIETLLAGAAQLVDSGVPMFAAQCELVAGDVELRRGQRARGLALVQRARARLVGDSPMAQALRAQADQIAPPRRR